MPCNHTTQKSTTIGNIAFLLLSFPLGLLYFLLMVIGLAVGVSTLILWIGLPILFATLVLINEARIGDGIRLILDAIVFVPQGQIQPKRQTKPATTKQVP